tara:strand:- start:14642 stop:17071 length:2430 start_codon:yes stop_codon:yes gene_type:complete
MPKQVWKIDKFHGGINNHSDPRDINENELAECVNYAVHNLGKLRAMGEFQAHAAGSNPSVTVEAGYSIFYFAHDRLEAEAISGTAAETGQQYLALADTDASAEIWIYAFGTDAWSSSAVLDLGSTDGLVPIFSFVDGTLRVVDGSFVGNTNKQLLYIKATHFNGISPAGSADSYDTWYANKNCNLAPPERGLFGDLDWTDPGDGSSTTTRVYHSNTSVLAGMGTHVNDSNDYVIISTNGGNKAASVNDIPGEAYLTTPTNSADWSGEAIRLYPPPGAGWNVDITAGSTGGTWTKGEFEIGTTFVYQGNQESLIWTNLGDGGSVSIVAGGYWFVKIFATSPFDPHIIGGRVYIREYNVEKKWTLLADISLRDGVRGDLTSDYNAWELNTADSSVTLNATTDTYCYGTLDNVYNKSPWTYDSINGFSPEEPNSIGLAGEGYNSIVIANRQAYIGNVRRKGVDGETITEADAMYKSMPNKFDTFPISRKIEASIKDGDEITALEVYADRILQFKKTKMHIINIAQDIEFLEDTFMHKGVDYPGQVCKTDYGIAWMNDHGAYLYNGQNVIDLLEKNGRLRISDSGSTYPQKTWSVFVGTATTTGKPQIGYIPKMRQIMFTRSAGTGSDGDIYLYDLKTQSWTYGDSKVDDSAKQSNFINDKNGDLVYSQADGTIKKWSDEIDSGSTPGDCIIKTKDIDFGSPGVRKNIYKVYLSFKGDGRAVDIQYSTNGDNNTTRPFYRTTVDGLNHVSDRTNSDTTPLANSASTDDWVSAELIPVADIRNVYSFQLVITGSTTSSFEINDISIIYRMKNII